MYFSLDKMPEEKRQSMKDTIDDIYEAYVEKERNNISIDAGSFSIDGVVTSSRVKDIEHNMAVMIVFHEDSVDHNDILRILKKYWLAYMDGMGEKGIVFVTPQYTLLEKLEPFIKENFNEEIGLREIISASVLGEIIFDNFSGEYIEKAKRIIEIKKILGKVIAKEPLLSGIEDLLLNLYFDEIRVNYASQDVIIDVSRDDNFQSLYMFEEEKEKKEIKKDAEEILAYFLSIKESQRLRNIYTPPKKSLNAVLNAFNIPVVNENPNHVGKINHLDKKRNEAYQYLEKFGDWEFIELEMLQVLKLIEKHGTTPEDYKRLQEDEDDLLVFRYQTSNYHYYFALKCVYYEEYESFGDISEFKIFCSKDKENSELRNYLSQFK